MKIALVGGTHGNEPVGIEVMKIFKSSSQVFKNSFECFWGNPKAFELKKRYVDHDLNRSFGKNNKTQGYEAQRAKELTEQIAGRFDFCIDLHTTTSNMGITAILNNSHSQTRKVSAHLLKKFPELKLIEEDQLDEECTHLNRLCPASLTIEVGPVANNVVSATLISKTQSLVEAILDFDFSSQLETETTVFYKMLGVICYPEGEGWYIHPKLENQDFQLLKKGDPIFQNAGGEVLFWQDQDVYPFFVNEAAYLENRSAFLISELKRGWSG